LRRYQGCGVPSISHLGSVQLWQEKMFILRQTMIQKATEISIVLLKDDDEENDRSHNAAARDDQNDDDKDAWFELY
jgi:hypothetical protein